MLPSSGHRAACRIRSTVGCLCASYREEYIRILWKRPLSDDYNKKRRNENIKEILPLTYGNLAHANSCCHMRSHHSAPISLYPCPAQPAFILHGGGPVPPYVRSALILHTLASYLPFAVHAQIIAKSHYCLVSTRPPNGTTPSQFVIPSAFFRSVNLGRVTTFVSMSVGFLCPGTQCTVTIPSAAHSLMKWWRLLMRLVLWWKSGFSVRIEAPFLSVNILGVRSYSRNSMTFLSYIQSWTPMLRAMFASSVDNRVVMSCFLDGQNIGEFPSLVSIPKVALSSSFSSPASVKISTGILADPEKLMLLFLELRRCATIARPLPRSCIFGCLVVMNRHCIAYWIPGQHVQVIKSILLLQASSNYTNA